MLAVLFQKDAEYRTGREASGRYDRPKGAKDVALFFFSRVMYNDKSSDVDISSVNILLIQQYCASRHETSGL